MGWVLNADGSAEFPCERVMLDAYGNVIRWNPPPRPEEPLSDALRLSGQQKAVYEIDKRTHRVRFEDEDENFVRIVIEPKNSPA